MARKRCPHGAVLPKGLKCDRGFLVIRIFTDKGPYNRGCGPHNKAMEAIARLEIGRIREQQYLKTFDLPSKTKRIKFDEAAKLFIKRHYKDYRDPETHQPRSSKSISGIGYTMNVLGEAFNDFYLDAITLGDLKTYRIQKIEFEDAMPGTLNRHMADLSSMLTQFERWNAEDDKAVQIKLPEKNPCLQLPDLKEHPRTRIASMDELRRLKAACQDLNDPSMWSIIETELWTSLRLGDLERLEDAEVKNGYFTIKQGKTGSDVSFPESAKPKWNKVFANFRDRWEAVRVKAFCGSLQFRDLRKTGLQMIESQFTPEQLAMKAGHSDSKVTKKWYLSRQNVEQNRSMLEATKKLLEGL